MLRGTGDDLEVLLIRRSERRGDPWSGHTALPGGRASERDQDAIETARREAREEIGLDLSGAQVLGRLPRRPRGWVRRWARLNVTPIVFHIHGDPPLSLDPREVADARWVPLCALASGAWRSEHTYLFRPVPRWPIELPLRVPCWRDGDWMIWGLTYDVLSDLIRLG